MRGSLLNLPRYSLKATPSNILLHCFKNNKKTMRKNKLYFRFNKIAFYEPISMVETLLKIQKYKQDLYCFSKSVLFRQYSGLQLRYFFVNSHFTTESSFQASKKNKKKQMACYQEKGYFCCGCCSFRTGTIVIGIYCLW